MNDERIKTKIAVNISKER